MSIAGLVLAPVLTALMVRHWFATANDQTVLATRSGGIGLLCWMILPVRVVVAAILRYHLGRLTAF